MKRVHFLRVLVGLLFATCEAQAQPVTLAVANHSFELPSQADAAYNFGASYPQQGGYGWLFSFNGTTSGMYNPPANTYAAAGGDGTPAGAQGSQAGWSTGGFIFQTLAGPDKTPGNADDPLLASATTYSLTVSIGARLPGNQYGIDLFGGYDIGLMAGNTIILREVNGFVPPAGTFVDRTLSVDSDTLSPSLYGQPISIFLASFAGDGVTDFDNVRLVSLTSVPEPATWMWLGAFVAIPAALQLRRARRGHRRRKPPTRHRVCCGELDRKEYTGAGKSAQEIALIVAVLDEGVSCLLLPC